MKLEVGLLAGVALSVDGQELGSMGVDFGDHTGRLSIYVTNFAEQPNNLYRNLGAQDFTDVGWSSKTGQNLPADAIYTIVEGEGIKETKALPPPAPPTPASTQ